MMWSYNDGGNWLAMAVVMVLVLAGILALTAWAIRTAGGPRRSDSAMDALRLRLATGQVTLEEFEKTKKALQG